MISWKLWRAIQSPQYTHPLFHRILASYGRRVSVFEMPHSAEEVAFFTRLDPSPTTADSSRALLRLLVVFGLVFSGICGGWLVLLLVVPLLLPTIGTIYGLSVTLRISSLIGQQRERGIYDLLNLTPTGPLGTSWAITTACLYRNTTFQRLRRWLRIGYVAAILLLGILIALRFYQWWDYVRFPGRSGFPRPELYQQELTIFVVLALSVAALYIDFIHSTVAGVLTAIISASYSGSRLEAWFLSSAMFIGVQLTTYLVTLGFLYALVLQPAVPFNNRNVPINDWRPVIIDCILDLCLFFFLREGLICLLWRMLAQRLPIHASELDMIRVKSPREMAV